MTDGWWGVISFTAPPLPGLNEGDFALMTAVNVGALIGTRKMYSAKVMFVLFACDLDPYLDNGLAEILCVCVCVCVCGS